MVPYRTYLRPNGPPRRFNCHLPCGRRKREEQQYLTYLTLDSVAICSEWIWWNSHSSARGVKISPATRRQKAAPLPARNLLADGSSGSSQDDDEEGRVIELSFEAKKMMLPLFFLPQHTIPPTTTRTIQHPNPSILLSEK